jgi:hypothetical protein
VAGRWLNSLYVMMWCWRCAWPGLGGGGSTGRRRGRAAAETRAHQRSGPVIPVHESENGRAGEHQWVMGMLIVHWIGARRRCGRQTTTGSSCGGGPARRGGREKKWPWKYGCGNIRTSVLGAPGCVSS